jgi:hypothetical protein
MSSKVFVGANSAFTAATNNLKVTGKSAGSENLLIQSGVSGVATDANIEILQLAGNLNNYSFQFVVGVGIKVMVGSITVATCPSFNQNMTVSFADGSATLVQSSGTGFTLGGQSITSTATTFNSTAMGSAFNTSLKSTASAVTPVDGTGSKVFMGTADSFIVANKNLKVNGSGGVGTEKISLKQAVTEVITDANIEKIDLVPSHVLSLG